MQDGVVQPSLHRWMRGSCCACDCPCWFWEAVTRGHLSPNHSACSCQALLDLPSSPENAGVDQLALGAWDWCGRRETGRDLGLCKKIIQDHLSSGLRIVSGLCVLKLSTGLLLCDEVDKQTRSQVVGIPSKTFSCAGDKLQAQVEKQPRTAHLQLWDRPSWEHGSCVG